MGERVRLAQSAPVLCFHCRLPVPLPKSGGIRLQTMPLRTHASFLPLRLQKAIL
jgi:hypothetical protein